MSEPSGDQKIDCGEVVPDTVFQDSQPAEKERTMSLISQTAVSIFNDRSTHMDGPFSNAPRKSVAYLCRTQMPPPESLREEWSLEPYGLHGSWGYVFKYETGEVCLYQLEENETFGPQSHIVTLTSNDWGVLQLMMPDFLWQLSPPSPKRVKGEKESYPSAAELWQRRMLFSATWDSKSAPPSRWFFHASLHTARIIGTTTSGITPMKTEADVFVLESFNSDCGVFKSLSVLPVAAWADRM